MNYGSSLREKEENFENLCCESSQPTVEYLEQGSKDSNHVETKMNFQACIGKPLPPRKAAAAAAAAAILCQYIRGQSPTTEKKRILSRQQNLDYNSWMTDVEKTLFEILIFKYVYFDTMIDVTMKKREQRIGMLYFQY